MPFRFPYGPVAPAAARHLGKLAASGRAVASGGGGGDPTQPVSTTAFSGDIFANQGTEPVDVTVNFPQAGDYIIVYFGSAGSVSGANDVRVQVSPFTVTELAADDYGSGDFESFLVVRISSVTAGDHTVSFDVETDSYGLYRGTYSVFRVIDVDDASIATDKLEDDGDVELTSGSTVTAFIGFQFGKDDQASSTFTGDLSQTLFSKQELPDDNGFYMEVVWEPAVDPSTTVTMTRAIGSGDRHANALIAIPMNA